MFRKIIFWAHLAAGLISGISVGIMCFTGTALAFEKQMIAWSQRDARQVATPAEGTPRLTLEQLRGKLREAQPEANSASVTITNDPRAAVAFGAGGRGAGGYYVNPYTGQVRQPQSAAMGNFMTSMVAWHRYLNFSGTESRPRGKWINGVCNLAFCALAMTGLYLWMPRTWSWRGVKAITLFNWRLTGKPRDFNWHNSIGLWTAPILIVLTLTAVPISFQWGGRLINTVTGTPQPAPGAPAGPGANALPPVVVPPPPADTRPMSQDQLLAIVQKEIPTWETITVGAAGGRGGGRGGPGAPAGGRGGRGEGGRGEGRGGRGEGRVGRGGGAEGAPSAAPATANVAAPSGEAAPARPTAPAASFTVRRSDALPRTAATTIVLNPYTGDVLRRTGYADLPAAQQVRAWTRFLHTGEALGFWGQLFAGLACLGGCFLVYTGFALSWRRFFGKPTDAPSRT